MMLNRAGGAATTPRQADHRSILRFQADAAARFAAACATLPGARVLRDVQLNEVSLSFDGQTQEIHDRLYRRGHRVKLTEWRAQKVMRFPFTDHVMAEGLAAEIFDSLVFILGQMDVAETRVW